MVEPAIGIQVGIYPTLDEVEVGWISRALVDKVFGIQQETTLIGPRPELRGDGTLGRYGVDRRDRVVEISRSRQPAEIGWIAHERWIVLLKTISRILDRERPISLRHELEVVCVGVVYVCDQILCAVVRLVGIHGVMKLPK